MFADTLESVIKVEIKEEVHRMVAGILTWEAFEVAFKEVMRDIFKPVARKQELAVLEYISEKQVGEFFPIAASTLKTWRSRNMPGPPYSRVGDRIIYKVSDLRAFFDQHKV